MVGLKLRWFGPNVGYGTEYDPAEIGAGGFNSLAVNLTDRSDLPAYVDRAHAAGIAVCGRVVGGSLDRFESVTQAALYYRTLKLDLATIGNEIDGDDAVNTDGSWLQSLSDWQLMRSEFVLAFNGGPPLYGPGTVTGDPSRLDRFPLGGLRGTDNHLYAQDQTSVWTQLQGYDRFDTQYGFTERISSEWGWPGADAKQRGQYVVAMVRAVESGNDQRSAQGQSAVVAMFPYCWAREQHEQPFYLNAPACLAEIRKLGYKPAQPLPAPIPGPQPSQPPHFVLGFAEAASAAPDLIGAAVENERGAVEGFSQQLTSEGLLTWTAVAGGVISFYRLSTRQRYLYRGGIWEAA